MDEEGVCMIKAWSLIGILLPISQSSYPPACQEQTECVLPTAREERDLLPNLNCEGRRLYQSLDCLAKRRALDLAPQMADKNVAVQEAAKEMGRRQLIEAEPPYLETEEWGGQEGYNKYGY